MNIFPLLLLPKYILWFYCTIYIPFDPGILTHLTVIRFSDCVSISGTRIPLIARSKGLNPNCLNTESSTVANHVRKYYVSTCTSGYISHKLHNGRSGPCFISQGSGSKKNARMGPGSYRLKLMPEDNDHKMLKELYLNRDELFDESLGKRCNLYRYFNITKSNIKDHLEATMAEYMERRKREGEKTVYVVDGNAFNGDPDWTLPLPRAMESYKIPDAGVDPILPMGTEDTKIEPKFENEVLESIYKMIPDDAEPELQSEADEKDPVKLYEEVGDNDYEVFDDYKEYTRGMFQDVKLTSNEETKRNRELLHRVMVLPTAFPSYIDPENPVHRTGRRRELQRKRDSGRLQRLRWEMDVDYKDDIPRGEWTRGDDITKEFNDSIEWEETMPTYHDNNYFKRSYYEGGFGDEDRTPDSFFDVQFIGSTDTYPFAVSAGMQFTWPIYWVPWLCKKSPKRRGQPIRSRVFNLGGVEPLQLWFYPEGTAQSIDGYCSLKLVSPPGWNLPYRIYLYVFSEYNRVVLGPMYRESSDYVTLSQNTCRLVPKSDKELLKNPQNDRDYVILGPSGNVYVGVGVVDEPIREHKQKYEFKYDWDEGDYDFNQWLKKQTSNPDDTFTMKTIEKDRTHSIWYESHKYRHVPDRHISRYWKTRFQDVEWKPPKF